MLQLILSGLQCSQCLRKTFIIKFGTYYLFIKLAWRFQLQLARACVLQRLSVTHAPHPPPPPLTTFFPISKTAFWWTSNKCILDNYGERNFQNHYFNVHSQSIRVALSSLLDSSINRNWELRLIKSLGAPFSFVSVTGNVLKLKIYKQCTTRNNMRLNWSN